MKELICIVCPKGCHLLIDEENNCKVTGNQCARGEEYGRVELTAPTRVVTSTVCAQGGLHPRLSVKTDSPIPKKKIMEAMTLLDGITVQAPIRTGDIIVKNLLNTGANFVATRDLL